MPTEKLFPQQQKQLKIQVSGSETQTLDIASGFNTLQAILSLNNKPNTRSKRRIFHHTHSPTRAILYTKILLSIVKTCLQVSHFATILQAIPFWGFNSKTSVKSSLRPQRFSYNFFFKSSHDLPCFVSASTGCFYVLISEVQHKKINLFFGNNNLTETQIS